MMRTSGDIFTHRLQGASAQSPDPDPKKEENKKEKEKERKEARETDQGYKLPLHPPPRMQTDTH